jgi:hypothetical protein
MPRNLIDRQYKVEMTIPNLFYTHTKRDLLKLTGKDRQSFLQGMVTNDVVKLQPGEGCYAFLLDSTGHVLADMHVLNVGDYLLLDLEPGMATFVYDNARQVPDHGKVPHHRRNGRLGTVRMYCGRRRAGIGNEISRHRRQFWGQHYTLLCRRRAKPIDSSTRIDVRTMYRFRTSLAKPKNMSRLHAHVPN